MRNLKKLMACLLSIAMLPAVVTKWQSNAEASTQVFVEDFESYEVGVIKQGAATYNYDPGTSYKSGIGYNLKSGDIIEIAQEANGNKYLKITRANTTTSYSRYTYFFPEIYKDKKYTVSYDFMPEEHNQYFRHFGSLWKQNADSTRGGVIKSVISYGKTIYYNSDPSKNDIPNILNTSKYDGTYATISQTIDFTDLSSSVLKGVLPDGTSKERTVGESVAPAGVGFFGLIWDIQVNSTASWNGGTDHTNASVYRIDNITVTKEELPLKLSSTNVANNGEIEEDTPFTMTFVDAVDTANVTLKKNGIAMAGEDYTVTVSGSTVSVIPTAGWINGSEYTVNVGQVTTTSSVYDTYPGTTFTLIGSSYLFVEDFENWTEGVIAQDAGSSNDNPGTSYTPGIGYNLKDGDKIEIAQEANGNKYLKITRANTSTTHSRYTYFFPQIYSGNKYTVSYNFMPEEHNQQFRHFGSLWKQNADSTRSGVIKQVMSFGQDIHYHSAYNTNYKISNIFNTAKYDGSAYATISQTVDFTNLNSSLLKTVLPDGTSGQRAVGSSTKPAGVGFFGLLWDIQINSTAAYNGSTDHTNPSVYRIDNIKIKAIPQRYLSANVADDAQGVATSTAVTLTFSEPVASASGITVIQNGANLVKDTDYTVAVSDKTVTITPSSSWRQGAEVVVSGTVTGTNTDISYTGRMLTFYTAGDYILSDINLSGNTVTANLTNNTASDKDCVAIVTQLDALGNISFFKYQAITVGDGETENISINFTSSAPTYNIYIWDGFANICPLTDKRVVSGS